MRGGKSYVLEASVSCSLFYFGSLEGEHQNGLMAFLAEIQLAFQTLCQSSVLKTLATRNYILYFSCANRSALSVAVFYENASLKYLRKAFKATERNSG